MRTPVKFAFSVQRAIPAAKNPARAEEYVAGFSDPCEALSYAERKVDHDENVANWYVWDEARNVVMRTFYRRAEEAAS